MDPKNPPPPPQHTVAELSPVSLTMNSLQKSHLTRLLPKGFSFEQLPKKAKQKPKPNKSKDSPYIINQRGKTMFDQTRPTLSSKCSISSLKAQTSRYIHLQSGEFAEVYQLIRKLRKQVSSYPFRVPVDPKQLNIPQYLKIIHQPMDLRTIEQNLKKEVYKHPSEVHCDIYKMLMNSYKFNQKNSDVYEATREFEQYYLEMRDTAKTTNKTMRSEKQSRKEQIVKMEVERQNGRNELHELTKLDSERQHSRQENDTKELKHQHSQIIPQKEQQQRNQSAQQVSPQLKSLFKKPLQEHSSVQPRHFLHASLPCPHTFNNSQFPSTSLHLKSNTSATSHPSLPIRQPSRIKRKRHKQPRPCQLIQPKQPQLNHQQQQQTERSSVIMMTQKKLNQLFKRWNQLPICKTKMRFSGLYTQPITYCEIGNPNSMSLAQRRQLLNKIVNLPSQDFRHIIQIVTRGKAPNTQHKKGVYDVDFDKLQPKTLKQLNNFISMRKSYINQPQQHKLYHSSPQYVQDVINDYIITNPSNKLIQSKSKSKSQSPQQPTYTKKPSSKLIPPSSESQQSVSSSQQCWQPDQQPYMEEEDQQRINNHSK